MSPGRPIIPDCGGESYAVAEYIDYFLLPLSKLHPADLKATPDFLKVINQAEVPKDAILVTIDVDALYTNINSVDGWSAVAAAFQQHPDPNRLTEEVLERLKICLQNNDFHFNGQWYLQIFGAPVGRIFSPNYANIFMAEWEVGALAISVL